jgi:putative ABC transport system substrate-binding protein
MHFHQWKRREFITLIGGAATAWPLAATGQQLAGKLPIVGFLGTSTLATWSSQVASFSQLLNELGWIEGRTIAIEYRWAEGRVERYSEIAAEFARLTVDVIVTSGGAVPAVTQVTSIIPIVFAVANDPLGTGLVTNLARPGANVTGLSGQSSDLAAKRVELLRDVAPQLRTLAIMANVSYSAAVLEMKQAHDAARGSGLNIAALEIRRARDIPAAFATLRGRAEAMYVCSDALMGANRTHINILAASARLPTIHAERGYVEAGGLMSYGPNYPSLFRRSAELVDKILRGTRPGDIPVEQPTKFDLVINLVTALALGIELPTSLLARADEVIE